MQSSKNSWSLQLRKALIFLFILTISSCSGGCGKRTAKKQGGGKAVVLFHGLGDVDDNGKSNLETLKEKLSSDLPGVKVIALARTNSAAAPLDQQATEAYEELKKQGVDRKEIIFFGQSQGAALAAGVWAKHRQDLQIKGLIFDRGPVGIQGCPAVNVTSKQVKEIKAQVKKAISVPDMLSGRIDNLIDFLLGLKGPGVSDMQPNSPYLTKINQELEKIDIPVFVVAAVVKDFKKSVLGTFGMNEESLKSWGIKIDNNAIENLRKLWYSVVGSDKNDLLIPLDSQMLSNIKNANIHRDSTWEDMTHLGYINDNKYNKIYTQVLSEIKKDLGLS
jgi:3-phosphoglycerate kinase